MQTFHSTLSQAPNEQPTPETGPGSKQSAAPAPVPLSNVRSEYTARWIRSVDELQSLVDPWRDLSEQAARRNAALEDNFLIPAFRHLSDPRVAVLVVEYQLAEATDPGEPEKVARHHGIVAADRPRLIGLAAFQTIQLLGWTLPVIRFWKHQQCFDTTPLWRKGWERVTWELMVARLQADGFRFLEMNTCSGAAPFDTWLETTRREQGLPLYRRKQFQRAALKPAACGETYLKETLSSKYHKKLRRLRRKLEQLGQVTLEANEFAADDSRLAEEFLELEQSGWKGTAGTALASDPASEAFYRELIARSSAQGKTRFLTLRLDGRPIAMLSDLRTGKTIHSYKTAYDEACAELSPGVQLELDNVKSLHRDNIQLADSCTAADNEMLNRIWRERIDYQSVILGLRPGWPRLVIACLPVVQRFLRFIRRRTV